MTGWSPSKCCGCDDAVARAVPARIQEKTGINMLPNIVVTARKRVGEIDELAAIREILSLSLVGKEHENPDILEVWMRGVAV